MWKKIQKSHYDFQPIYLYILVGSIWKIFEESNIFTQKLGSNLSCRSSPGLHTVATISSHLFKSICHVFVLSLGNLDIQIHPQIFYWFESGEWLSHIRTIKCLIAKIMCLGSLMFSLKQQCSVLCWKAVPSHDISTRCFVVVLVFME